MAAAVEGSPSSPSSLAMLPVDVEALPYNHGANDSFPYACQFCDKAYNKLSYLKAHEQVNLIWLKYI